MGVSIGIVSSGTFQIESAQPSSIPVNACTAERNNEIVQTSITIPNYAFSSQIALFPVKLVGNIGDTPRLDLCCMPPAHGISSIVGISIYLSSSSIFQKVLIHVHRAIRFVAKYINYIHKNHQMDEVGNHCGN